MVQPRFAIECSDSSWAVDEESKQILLESAWAHLIRCWPSRQHIIALSSVVAESYALLNVASQTIGTVGVAADFGVKRLQECQGPPCAISSTLCLGKVRRIDAQHLWIQELVKRLAIAHIQG